MKYNFLIIGFGSIGRRHTRNIKHLYPNSKIYLISKTPTNIFKEENLIYKRIKFKDLDLIKNKMIVFICNTPNLHLKTANKFINLKYSIFIEKPISSNIVGLNNFISNMRKNKIVCHLGYQFRYHPLILNVKKLLDKKKFGEIISVQIKCSSFLPSWRSGGNYKNEISANKNLGGGVLLELSHEIDYAYFLFGNFKTVSSHIFKTKFLEINSEDSIDFILNNKNFNCNIHLDFHSRYKERYIKINLTKATIKVDLIKNKVFIFNDSKIKEVNCEKNTYDKIYLNEIKDFVKNIKKNNYENKILKDSYFIMKIINACQKSNQLKKIVKI